MKVWTVILFISAAQVLSTQSRSISHDMVSQLAVDVFDFKLKENPNLASGYGIDKYQDMVEEWNPVAFDRRVKKSEDFLAKVEEYLSMTVEKEEDVLTLKIMKYLLEKFVDGAKFMSYTRSLNVELSGLKYTVTISNPVDTEEKLFYWDQKIVLYQQVFDNQLSLLDEGITSGLTPAKSTCEYTIKRYKDAIGDSSADFFAFQPYIDLDMINKNRSLYDHGQEQSGVLRTKMSQFLEKLENEYLPACREKGSASSLPGGDKYYEAALKHYTADYATPEYVHNLGLKEVERITTDMKQIIASEGFNGGIGDYTEYLLGQPRETFPTSAELKQGYADILNDRIRPNLLSEFYPEPKIGIDIVDDPVGSLGMYYSPRANGSNTWTNGKFVYDGSKPEEILKVVMLPLMVHESIPGHHYQIAHKLSEVELPDIRKYSDSRHKDQAPFASPSIAEYTEGWALYAEYLSEQMGIVKTDKERFGKLSMESLRAARLVVDTGVHYYNWTMARAAEYLKENTALSNASCWGQIQRYVRWPGQACSYKIGEIKIKEIRQRAEKELGDEFDPREFHKVMLDLGPCPLELMEQEMNKWIESEKPKVNSAVDCTWSGIVFSILLFFCLTH